MRAIAAHLHLHQTSEEKKKVWDDDAKAFVERAYQINSPLYDKSGHPVTRPLNMHIDVLHRNGRNRYAIASLDASFSSLHRAKNAIRRHFSIPSRRQLIWREEVRS